MKIISRLQSLIGKTAINSWSWYHFIVLYAIIPFIILIIPSIGLDKFFLLDMCHPTFLSMYMTNFIHLTLPHLSANLEWYILSITGIFFLERNKTRFCIMLTFFFVILPIFISIFSIEYFRNFCTVQESLATYGFSTISAGFFGYFIYLLLLSFMPSLFKWIEEGFCISKIKGIDTVYWIIVVNSIIAFFIILIGTTLGRLSLVSGASNNNSLAHSIGYISGIFFPMILELKNENKIDSFHMTLLIQLEALIIFLTVYILLYYFEWIA